MLRASLVIIVALIYGQSGLADPGARTANEKLSDFGLVYLAQWSVYGITQAETIRDHGRLSNMLEFATQPQFDKDDFNYNLVKHAISGHYYYLFYRARGYQVEDAFIGSFVSSLAFEFAIETLTEKPSIQDIYQTPVFGTILGMGAEALSMKLSTSSSRLVRGFSFLLNPLVLVKREEGEHAGPSAKLLPVLNPMSPGLYLVGEF